jgi:hypothetical protein
MSLLKKRCFLLLILSLSNGHIAIKGFSRFVDGLLREDFEWFFGVIGLVPFFNLLFGLY